MSSVSAITDMNHNGFIHCVTSAQDDKKTEGLIHEFGDVLCRGIGKVAVRDALATREDKHTDFELESHSFWHHSQYMINFSIYHHPLFVNISSLFEPLNSSSPSPFSFIVLVPTKRFQTIILSQ